MVAKKNQELNSYGLENLRYAILRQAVAECTGILSHTLKETADCNKRELEKFFKSQWFNEICDYDGNNLMKKIKEQVNSKD